MNIYTSYFGKIKNFPKNFVTVAICGGIPDFYTGLWYRKVAPKWNFFCEWKKNHDNNFYIEHFNNEVLSKITPQDFINDIKKLTNNAENVILLCYEKPNEFCHRHLVANWINNANMGINIEEWNLQKDKKQD